MEEFLAERFFELETTGPIWERFYTVAPLVVIGSKGKEEFDLAPKHLAMPLGWDNYFCFVCTPSHQTYKNTISRREFTVSFVKPDNMVLASLAASPKCEVDSERKEIVDQLPTFKSKEVDALYLQNSYLYLDCKLDQIIDGFGRNSLIIGTIQSAFIEKSSLRTSEFDEGQLINENPLMVYLPPNRFASVNQSQAFPFPKDFKK